MSPIAVFLLSMFIAYMVLSAVRANFMKGRNPVKKQTDVGLLVALTAFLWALVPSGM